MPWSWNIYSWINGWHCLRGASSLAVLFLSVCFDVRLEEICLTLERSLGMKGKKGKWDQKNGLIIQCLNRSFQAISSSFELFILHPFFSGASKKIIFLNKQVMVQMCRVEAWEVSCYFYFHVGKKKKRLFHCQRNVKGKPSHWPRSHPGQSCKLFIL